MNTKPIFAIGYAAPASKAGPALPAMSLDDEQMRNVSAEDLAGFKAMLTTFAGKHLGLTLVDRNDLQAQALAATYYPVGDKDVVQWDQPLFDSDGFPHTLVSLAAIEVVTKISFCYVVWDRKTGECRSKDGGEGYTIGNTPMTDEERQTRANAALESLRSIGMSEMVENRHLVSRPAEAAAERRQYERG